MSDINIEDAKELDFVYNNGENKGDDDSAVGDPKHSDVPVDAKHLDFVDNTPNDKDDHRKHSDVHEEIPMPSHEEEEETIKKKYGGMLPKKPPLISKDHERAFFDSADWALGKQGAQKTKGPLEALLPKWQPTPHPQLRSRRSAYAPTDDSEVDDDSRNDTPPTDQSFKLIDASDNCNASSADQSCGN